MNRSETLKLAVDILDARARSVFADPITEQAIALIAAIDELAERRRQVGQLGLAVGKLHERIDELEDGISQAQESLRAGRADDALDALCAVLEEDGPRVSEAEPIDPGDDDVG